MGVARADVVKADGQLKSATSARQQTLDELETKRRALPAQSRERSFREIERTGPCARAKWVSLPPPPLRTKRAEERIEPHSCSKGERRSRRWRKPKLSWIRRSSVLGVSGRVEQFTLRVGDIVNPLMRPAGILIPEGAGQQGLQAGFDQIEAQIMTIGMAAEVTCVLKAF